MFILSELSDHCYLTRDISEREVLLTPQEYGEMRRAEALMPYASVRLVRFDCSPSNDFDRRPETFHWAVTPY